jgi:hypothetical protein
MHPLPAVVANICVEDWSDGISSGINLVNKAAAATFIFTAAASFDQTLYGGRCHWRQPWSTVLERDQILQVGVA